MYSVYLSILPHLGAVLESLDYDLEGEFIKQFLPDTTSADMLVQYGLAELTGKEPDLFPAMPDLEIYRLSIEGQELAGALMLLAEDLELDDLTLDVDTLGNEGCDDEN